MDFKFLTPATPADTVTRRQLITAEQRSHTASYINRHRQLRRTKQHRAGSVRSVPKSSVATYPTAPNVSRKQPSSGDTPTDSADDSDWSIQSTAVGAWTPELSDLDASPFARAMTPDQYLGNGRSDPFDCFPIKVTPMIHQIIGFARGAYLPAVHGKFSTAKSLHEPRSLNLSKALTFL